jgi:uncharacterized protein (DUF1501 family)
MGWLGRYLDAAVTEKDDHFAGLVGAGAVNPAVRGQAYNIPTIANANAYQLQTDPRFSGDRVNRLNAFSALNSAGADNRAMLPLLEDTATAAYASSRELQEFVRSYTPAVEYPDTDIGDSLKLMAQVVSADVGLQVGYVTRGGFDTHADQINPQRGQQALLGQVADAVAAFLADIEAHGLGDKVLVLMWSEFGRRVDENGSRGTDHGSAQPMFIAGTRVKGGLYGAYPSLTDLDDKNLKFSTEFRSVYATILADWLQTDPGPILKGSYPTLGFVA